MEKIPLTQRYVRLLLLKSSPIFPCFLQNAICKTLITLGKLLGKDYFKYLEYLSTFVSIPLSHLIVACDLVGPLDLSSTISQSYHILYLYFDFLALSLLLHASSFCVLLQLVKVI